MARPTHDQIIREMGQDVVILKERMASVQVELDRLLDLKVQVALLKQRVDDMHKGWKTWMQRLWMLLAPIAGVAIGYYLNRK
jgi:hypothetical protein